MATGKEKREISRQMESLIERCFKRCQGMERYSTEESDEYWELGQKLMALWSQRSGKKIVRKESRV